MASKVVQSLVENWQIFLYYMIVYDKFSTC